MNAETHNTGLLDSEADAAKRRLLSVSGDPFIFADWERVVFLHFTLPADLLGLQIAGPFDLELHEGRGVVSLAALTMRRFRPARPGAGWVLGVLREQRFLNLRTYVRWRDEPGALFLWGWLSRPFGLPLPGGFGLPFSFVSYRYRHDPNDGNLAGEVRGGSQEGRLAYRAVLNGKLGADQCAPDSLSAFAMERYTGFFNRRNGPSIFRAWHPPWQRSSLEVILEDTSLVTRRFPWFAEARLIGADFAAGFERVWLGRAHSLAKVSGHAGRHHGLSAFYEMP